MHPLKSRTKVHHPDFCSSLLSIRVEPLKPEFLSLNKQKTGLIPAKYISQVPVFFIEATDLFLNFNPSIFQLLRTCFFLELIHLLFEIF